MIKQSHSKNYAGKWNTAEETKQVLH